MSQGERQPAKVIVSYSHRDAEALKRLQVHLKPLMRDRGLALWDDTRLRAGDRWREEIRDAIASAGVAVLLVSADFLASDFIREHELPPLVEAERAGAIRLMAVVLGPCRYNETPELERLQSVNPPSRPLSAMAEAEREAVWVMLANAIEAVAFPREPGKPAPKTLPKAPPRRPHLRTGLIAMAPLVAVLAGALVIRESGRPGTAPQPKPPEAPGKVDTAKAPPEVPAAVLGGYVLDAATGKPLADVTVTIEDYDTRDGRTPTAIADAAGRFRFDDLKPAPDPAPPVRLVAHRPGYITSHTSPTLGATSLAIKLRPEAPKKDGP